jgi:serine/threonine protein kinase
MMYGKYPFATSFEDEMLENILAVLGPITVEQVRDIGVDPLDFPELLVSSTTHMRRCSDIQDFSQTPSVGLRSLLSQALEYSPRRRTDAATLLEHDFFKVEPMTT